MDNENQTSEANLLKAAAECLEKAVPMDTDEQKTHFRTVEEITSYWNQELDKVYYLINTIQYIMINDNNNNNYIYRLFKILFLSL